jgi:uncharacterized coiled-coil protein SlyX/tetrahydromethanopterin S-methyltransferase subunit G
MFNKKSLIIVSSIVLIVAICYLKHWHVESEIEEHDKKIESTINSIVKDNIRNQYPALYLPHICMDTLVIQKEDNDSIINISKLFDEELNEIETRVTDYFVEYYRKQDSICKAESVVPFIIYPTEKDNNGNVVIQPKDLENIKKHIEFLTSEVEKAVSDIKQELSYDIDRLNLWTSVWIGVLGLLGTIFPLFIQFQSNNKLKDFQKNIAKQEESLKNSEKDLRKDFRDQFQTYETKIDGASKASNEAISKSNDAKNRSDQVINELSKVENKTALQDEKINQFSETLSSLQSDLQSKEESVSLLNENVKRSNEELVVVRETATAAKTNSEIAMKSSRELKSIVFLSNNLGNLKQMDFYKDHLYGKKIESYLSLIFQKIKNSLSEYKIEYNSDFDDLFKGLVGDMIKFQTNERVSKKKNSIRAT